MCNTVLDEKLGFLPQIFNMKVKQLIRRKKYILILLSTAVLALMLNFTYNLSIDKWSGIHNWRQYRGYQNNTLPNGCKDGENIIENGQCLCAEYPHNLVGRLNISFDIDPVAMLDGRHGNLQPGGVWSPRDCVARHRVAIIIPYRNRKQHLQLLLFYLIPILQKQMLEFRIVVAEQAGNDTFSRGRIMNAGFLEVLKMKDYNCYVFHDVDMIPEDDRNMYTCPKLPRHMSPAVDKFNYTLPYKNIVGGVFSIRKEHFMKVNGFSNMFIGWGAEDDDMYRRLIASNLSISRPSQEIGRYKMIQHEQSPKSLSGKHRWHLVRTANERFHHDGLNSLRYKVQFIHYGQLYTHIMVSIADK